MTIKTARARLARRQRKYVVGYIAPGNTVYGGGDVPRLVAATDPLSLNAARKMLDTMPCAGCAIFRLVPVQVNR